MFNVYSKHDTKRQCTAKAVAEPFHFCRAHIQGEMPCAKLADQNIIAHSSFVTGTDGPPLHAIRVWFFWAIVKLFRCLGRFEMSGPELERHACVTSAN